MKKLTLFFVVVILLFTGCGEKSRAVELTDFEYIYYTDGINNRFVYITANVDINDFAFKYFAKDHTEAIIDTFTISVGEIIATRTYRVCISSWSKDVINGNISDIEITAATGKVKT